MTNSPTIPRTDAGSFTSAPETPPRATLGWSYSGLRLMLVIAEFPEIKT